MIALLLQVVQRDVFVPLLGMELVPRGVGRVAVGLGHRHSATEKEKMGFNGEIHRTQGAESPRGACL